ncbi:SET1 [Enterospora canceri]|uniref:SET1 n=1 Tax=Enterospora canceri TaxID=1081671 RepID=A0A1Y1S8E0_9MICR|nr:SET1 [Enterospora canceri]
MENEKVNPTIGSVHCSPVRDRRVQVERTRAIESNETTETGKHDIETIRNTIAKSVLEMGREEDLMRNEGEMDRANKKTNGDFLEDCTVAQNKILNGSQDSYKKDGEEYRFRKEQQRNGRGKRQFKKVGWYSQSQDNKKKDDSWWKQNNYDRTLYERAAKPKRVKEYAQTVLIAKKDVSDVFNRNVFKYEQEKNKETKQDEIEVEQSVPVVLKQEKEGMVAPETPRLENEALKCYNSMRIQELEPFNLENCNEIDQLPEAMRNDFYLFCELTGFFDRELCFRALKNSIFSNKWFGKKNLDLSYEEKRRIAKERKAIRATTKYNQCTALDRRHPGIFEVRPSRIHGKGVFTNVKCPTDTFLFSYEGELIGKCMVEKREREYAKNGIKSTYLFSVYPDKVIDATMCGNVARYVNHSCEANCMTHHCLDTGAIKYYTLRVIEAGEELTINYCSDKILECECNCESAKCKRKWTKKKE